VTRQWFSLHGAVDPVALDPPRGGRLELLRVERHGNKLRTGHLRGNRFRLRLELCDGAEAALESGLAGIATHGLANRFGPQRFGIAGANLTVARAWGRGDAAAAVEAIVAPKGGWRLGDALPLSAGSGFRRRVIGALRRRPDEAGRALAAAGRGYRKLIASAAQSAVFNAVLDARAQAGLLHVLRAGDVARTPRGGAFVCSAEDLADANRRAAPGLLELSATGPLPGRSRFTPSPEIAAEERAWSRPAQVCWSWFERGAALDSPGERRRLLVRCLEDPALERDGDGIWLSVALPRGSYATELLEALGIAVPAARGG
jgi:tRNA pseudouridine13 synthase